ncbi:MAG: hypothetical protein WC651_01615 [Candidatus Gracilibacteria bacterium]|jgi:hypothetical protein
MSNPDQAPQATEGFAAATLKKAILLGELAVPETPDAGDEALATQIMAITPEGIRAIFQDTTPPDTAEKIATAQAWATQVLANCKRNLDMFNAIVEAGKYHGILEDNPDGTVRLLAAPETPTATTQPSPAKKTRETRAKIHQCLLTDTPITKFGSRAQTDVGEADGVNTEIGPISTDALPIYDKAKPTTMGTPSSRRHEIKKKLGLRN